MCLGTNHPRYQIQMRAQKTLLVGQWPLLQTDLQLVLAHRPPSCRNQSLRQKLVLRTRQVWLRLRRTNRQAWTQACSMRRRKDHLSRLCWRQQSQRGHRWPACSRCCCSRFRRGMASRCPWKARHQTAICLVCCCCRRCCCCCCLAGRM